jgi:hypothetical protein
VIRLRRRRGAHEQRPSEPLYGDQRKWGLALTTRVKALIIAIVAFLTGLAALALYLLAYLADARVERQQDQRQLACLLVLHYPTDSPIPLVREIRAKYPGCPYQAARTPRTPSQAPSSSASTRRNRPRAGASATPGAQQPPGGAATAAEGAAGHSGPPALAQPAATRTVVRLTPGPTHTVTRTVPASPAPGPPLLPPVVCDLPVVNPICGLLGG